MRKSEGQKTPEKEIANFKFTKPFERGEILFSKGFFCVLCEITLRKLLSIDFDLRFIYNLY